MHWPPAQDPSCDVQEGKRGEVDRWLVWACFCPDTHGPSVSTTANTTILNM